jgi:hypothetical protein
MRHGIVTASSLGPGVGVALGTRRGDGTDPAGIDLREFRRVRLASRCVSAEQLGRRDAEFRCVATGQG